MLIGIAVCTMNAVLALCFLMALLTTVRTCDRTAALALTVVKTEAFAATWRSRNVGAHGVLHVQPDGAWQFSTLCEGENNSSPAQRGSFNDTVCRKFVFDCCHVQR